MSHQTRDATEASIMRWDGNRLGVDYRFNDGVRYARAVGPMDWPIIRQLERRDALRYRDADAWRLLQLLRELNLDR